MKKNQPTLPFEKEEPDESQVSLHVLRPDKNVLNGGMRRELPEDLRVVSSGNAQQTSGQAERRVPSYREGLVEQIIRDEITLREGLGVPECPGDAFYESRIEAYTEELFRLDHGGTL